VTLDSPDEIDFIGFETATGVVVLTIADSWDWTDETGHLVALQVKFYRYLDFIESGQHLETQPEGQIRIDIVTRFPMSDRGLRLVEALTAYAKDQGVAVQYKHVPSTS